ncbi:MAG: hypothetical protein RL009_927 [Actinomycetota bacterium]
MARVKPSLGDRLGLGIETNTVCAVSLEVAEDACLVAAKRECCNRNRDGHVDADHPDLDFALKTPGSTPIIGENRSSVAEFTGVDQSDPRFITWHTDDRENWAENLV